jgi:energy-coupling factor transporter ATP-binding protein EcfA2
MLQPHILLLDEPTNHLDLEGLDALMNALKGWNGGVIVISHDERFITTVAKELWVCGEGTVQLFRGDVQAYKVRSPACAACAATDGRIESDREQHQEQALIPSPLYYLQMYSYVAACRLSLYSVTPLMAVCNHHCPPRVWMVAQTPTRTSSPAPSHHIHFIVKHYFYNALRGRGCPLFESHGHVDISLLLILSTTIRTLGAGRPTTMTAVASCWAILTSPPCSEIPRVSSEFVMVASAFLLARSNVALQWCSWRQRRIESFCKFD